MIWTLFLTFLKIGFLSIGGGYAIIPLIQEVVVNSQQWLTQKTFTDIITISQMTPGPLAVNTSTFVGMQIGNIPGAIAATIGCTLGGVLISLFLLYFFTKHQESSVVSAILNGLKSASVGLIASAGGTILLLTFFETSNFKELGSFDLKAVFIALVSLFLLRKFKINPILLMCVMGVVGYFVYTF